MPIKGTHFWEKYLSNLTACDYFVKILRTKIGIRLKFNDTYKVRYTCYNAWKCKSCISSRHEIKSYHDAVCRGFVDLESTLK
jgi:hypothetical protein